MSKVWILYKQHNGTDWYDLGDAEVYTTEDAAKTRMLDLLTTRYEAEDIEDVTIVENELISCQEERP